VFGKSSKKFAQQVSSIEVSLSGLEKDVGTLQKELEKNQRENQLNRNEENCRFGAEIQRTNDLLNSVLAPLAESLKKVGVAVEANSLEGVKEAICGASNFLGQSGPKVEVKIAISETEYDPRLPPQAVGMLNVKRLQSLANGGRGRNVSGLLSPVTPTVGHLVAAIQRDSVGVLAEIIEGCNIRGSDSEPNSSKVIISGFVNGDLGMCASRLHGYLNALFLGWHYGSQISINTLQGESCLIELKCKVWPEVQ